MGLAPYQVRLDPAPFGVGWRVERQGAFFVVRDDREISVYDGATGIRLWKRTWPLHVAFAGERDGRHITVIPEADESGVQIALADLASGAFDAKLHIDGSMRFIGAHGTIAGDLLYFATDQRDVFAVDIARWQVVQRHRLGGSHLLPPVVTAGGVHVAAVERREGAAFTELTSLERGSGLVLSTHTLPGAAHSLAAGESGLIIEWRRSPRAPVERLAFRPENPAVRLTEAKHVALGLPRHDLPRLPHATQSSDVQSARIVRAAERAAPDDGGQRRDELLPEPRNGNEGPPRTPRDGLLGLLALLDARSEVLMRITEALAASGTGTLMRIHKLGITLRDPRARWSAGAGRDPSLVDLAETREGEAIATYLYPPANSNRVPVVVVSRTTGEARWLADDFDVWFAGVLHDAAATAPHAASELLSELGLASDFPRSLPRAIPPPWFFEAHATSWTPSDVDVALAAGDLLGAERMLVSLARTNAGAVKERLAALYVRLGWDHHRATVVETW